MAAKLNIDEIMESYPAVSANANRMCQEIVRQIETVIRDKGYQTGFPVQSRVKAKERVLDKLESGLGIKKLEDMQDLAGIRITLLFNRDIPKIIKDLEGIFEIEKMYNTQDRLEENQFGYSSIHMIVKIKPEWLVIPTFQGLDCIKAEIQIRTLAQHTWAASSHALQYKRVASTPRPLRRSINRIAALLETVDLEIERLLHEQNEYANSMVETQEEEINVDSVRKLMDELYPEVNKRPTEKYDQIVHEIGLTTIKTISELRQILNESLADILKEDAERASKVLEMISENPSSPFASDIDRFQKGAYYAHTGLFRMALRRKFPQVDEYLKDLQDIERAKRKKARAPLPKRIPQKPN